MRFLIYFKKIFQIISKKNRYYLIIQFLNLFIVSFFETLGIGMLALYVNFLANKEDFLSKIPPNINKFFQFYNFEDLFMYVSIFIVFLFILKNFYLFLSNYFTLKLKQRILSESSNRAFKAVIDLEYEKFSELQNSEIVYKVFNEVSRVSNFILGYILTTKEILLISFLITPFFITNFSSSLFMSLFFILIISILIFSIKKSLRTSARNINKFSILMLQNINSIVDNYILIKLNDKLSFFLKKFSNILSLNIKNRNKQGILQSIPRIVFEVLGVLILVVISIALSKSNLKIENFIGELTFLALAFARLIPAFTNLNSNINTILFNEESFKKFYNLFYKKKNNIELNNQTSKIALDEREFKIKLQNVSFKFKGDNNYLLKDINIQFNQNNLIGITGRSGSGKSTLIKLILGFLKPSNGQIFINDFNLKTPNLLKHHVGFMSQKVILSNSSIKSNIALGVDDQNIDQKKIEEIFSSRFFKDIFIGINSEYIINENSNNLSGGQIQSIGIARAVYSNSKIIILDEPTNNLDMMTKKIFIDYINSIKVNKIVFVISHDQLLLDKCDKVCLLKEKSLREVNIKDTFKEVY